MNNFARGNPCDATRAVWVKSPTLCGANVQFLNASVGCVISRTLNHFALTLGHVELPAPSHLRGDDLFHGCPGRPAQRPACAASRDLAPGRSRHQGRTTVRYRGLGRPSQSPSLYLATSRWRSRFFDPMAIDQIPVLACPAERTFTFQPCATKRARHLATPVLGTPSQMRGRLQCAPAALLVQPGETWAGVAPSRLGLFKCAF